MTVLVAIVVCWIVVSIPVAFAIGRASALAAEREVERKAMRPVAELRRTESTSMRRAA